VHAFGADRTLDYVVRLTEIIRHYERLVEYLLGDSFGFAYVPGVQYPEAMKRYGDYLIASAFAQGGSRQAAADALGVSRNQLAVRAYRKRHPGRPGIRLGLEPV
jgi:hypothetical protein